MSTTWSADMDRMIDALVAHVPGAAGLIRAAYGHILDRGRIDPSLGCCTRDR